MRDSTSTEIIEAIAYLAPSEADAVRIWSEPTTREIIAVWMEVTHDGEIPSTEFYWGELGFKWGEAAGSGTQKSFYS